MSWHFQDLVTEPGYTQPRRHGNRSCRAPVPSPASSAAGTAGSSFPALAVQPVALNFAAGRDAVLPPAFPHARLFGKRQPIAVDARTHHCALGFLERLSPQLLRWRGTKSPWAAPAPAFGRHTRDTRMLCHHFVKRTLQTPEPPGKFPWLIPASLPLQLLQPERHKQAGMRALAFAWAESSSGRLVPSAHRRGVP